MSENDLSLGTTSYPIITFFFNKFYGLREITQKWFFFSCKDRKQNMKTENVYDSVFSFYHNKQKNCIVSILIENFMILIIKTLY